jgi:uncharacterized protein with NRDE domain
MCTVLFAPTGKSSLIASLRDESPRRVGALVPAAYEGNEMRYVMPLDPTGGGSWVGYNEAGAVVVLLNGAFEKHIPAPPYRLSRGIIVRTLLDSRMPVVEWMLMPMENIEPYTLIVFSDGKLFRLAWDGKEKSRQPLDETTTHIFSSATLYDKEAKSMRENYFRNWIAMNPPLDKLSILSFFQSLKDTQNGFIMNRNELVQTLSYSFICMDPDGYSFHYYDLQKYQFHTTTL